MPAHFENGEKCDGCKILASVHTIPQRFENGMKLDGKNSLQDFDAKEVYLRPKDRSVSFQKRPEMFCFHHFQVFCLHDAVSKMCRLKFHFQSLPVSKSAGKKCAVFV